MFRQLSGRFQAQLPAENNQLIGNFNLKQYVKIQNKTGVVVHDQNSLLLLLILSLFCSPPHPHPAPPPTVPQLSPNCPPAGVARQQVIAGQKPYWGLIGGLLGGCWGLLGGCWALHGLRRFFPIVFNTLSPGEHATWPAALFSSCF